MLTIKRVIELFDTRNHTRVIDHPSSIRVKAIRQEESQASKSRG